MHDGELYRVSGEAPGALSDRGGGKRELQLVGGRKERLGHHPKFCHPLGAKWRYAFLETQTESAEKRLEAIMKISVAAEPAKC
jgi:hypothetical protein